MLIQDCNGAVLLKIHHMNHSSPSWLGMREFYRGGPRTCGAALLIVAIALLVGWLRGSLGTDDFLLEAMNNGRVGESFHLRSSDNAIRLICIQHVGNSPRKHEVLVPPYAVVVPPLSLLAACLMLKRPQQRSMPGTRNGDRHD